MQHNRSPEVREVTARKLVAYETIFKAFKHGEGLNWVRVRAQHQPPFEILKKGALVELAAELLCVTNDGQEFGVAGHGNPKFGQHAIGLSVTQMDNILVFLQSLEASWGFKPAFPTFQQLEEAAAYDSSPMGGGGSHRAKSSVALPVHEITRTCDSEGRRIIAQLLRHRPPRYAISINQVFKRAQIAPEDFDQSQADVTFRLVRPYVEA